MAPKIICKKCGNETTVNMQRNAAACKHEHCDNYEVYYTIGTEGYNQRYLEV